MIPAATAVIENVDAIYPTLFGKVSSKNTGKKYATAKDTIDFDMLPIIQYLVMGFLIVYLNDFTKF